MIKPIFLHDKANISDKYNLKLILFEILVLSNCIKSNFEV